MLLHALILFDRNHLPPHLIQSLRLGVTKKIGCKSKDPIGHDLEGL
jgi:hypothetical protein